MSGKVCRETRREIDHSELRQTLSAEAEGHVAACAACAAFRDERLRLRELVGALEPVVAPVDFDVRLRARIARERDSHKQPFIFRFVMSTPAITVAAALVMVVGSIVFMNQRNRTPVPAIVSTNEKPAAATTETVSPSVPPKSDNNVPVQPTVVAALPSENSTHPNSTGRNITRSITTPVGLEASDSTVSRANSYQILKDRAGEVSLNAPVKPMVVTMYDERGGSRKIQLPPISFGSQRLTDNRRPVSMTNTRDW